MRAYKPLFEAREVQGSSLTQIACALWLIKDVRLSNKVKRGGGGNSKMDCFGREKGKINFGVLDIYVELN